MEETLRKQETAKHAADLRNQIHQHEQEKLNIRRDFFSERIKVEEEIRLRRLRLEETRERKLQELR